MNRIVLSLGLLFLPLLAPATARAAQSAQVVVQQAKIYQYPQATSMVVGSVNKGQSIAVSNQPTQNFYKTRLANGTLGWVSGNDVRVNAPAIPKGSQYNAGTYANSAPAKKSSGRKLREGEPGGDSMRILLGYGVQYLSYSGLVDTYGNAGKLNPGKHFSGELQFKLNPKLYWALRLEVMSADSGSQSVDSAGTKQDIQISSVPVEVGVVWSPISTHKFRWGLGAYIGAVVSSSASITRTDSAGVVNKVQYSTSDLCGNLSTQASFGLGDALGIFLQADYRYDQTGATPAVSQIVTSAGGFKINYSGVEVIAGLELRF